MKRNKWEFLLRVVSLWILITSLITLLTGFRVYKKTFKTKPRQLEKSKLEEKLKKLEHYPQQRFLVESSQNKYNIEVLHIKSLIESDNVIILVHGIGKHYYDLLPIAHTYLKDGYNVILYNQRQSGLTGGKNITFGLYEQYDLEEIATIARRMYRTGIVGVHGFSMGAATAAMQSGLNEKSNFVDFYILDSPYHTMESALQLGAKREGQKMPFWYVRFAGDAYLRLRERVSYKEIAPIAALSQTSKPVLLLHGESDEVTSPNSSRELLAAVNHPRKRLEIFAGLGHCRAAFFKKADYFDRIYKFMGDFL